MTELVSDNRGCSGGWVQSIDLIWQPGDRTEVLKVPVQRVCEVDVSIARVDSHIIERVELTTEVVVDEDFGVISNEAQGESSVSSPVVLYGSRGFITNSDGGMSAPCPSPVNSI